MGGEGMKKIIVALLAAMTLGSAMAASPKNNTPKADGAISVWAG